MVLPSAVNCEVVVSSGLAGVDVVLRTMLQHDTRERDPFSAAIRVDAGLASGGESGEGAEDRRGDGVGGRAGRHWREREGEEEGQC